MGDMWITEKFLSGSWIQGENLGRGASKEGNSPRLLCTGSGDGSCRSVDQEVLPGAKPPETGVQKTKGDNYHGVIHILGGLIHRFLCSFPQRIKDPSVV